MSFHWLRSSKDYETILFVGKKYLRRLSKMFKTFHVPFAPLNWKTIADRSDVLNLNISWLKEACGNDHISNILISSRPWTEMCT